MSHLQSLKVGALENEAMGPIGLFALWSLGRPYRVRARGLMMVKRNFLEKGILIGQLDMTDFKLVLEFRGWVLIDDC